MLTITSVVEALIWSVVAGLGTWFVLTPLRHRSFAGLLSTLVLVGAASSAGALWGAVHSMLVPEFGWGGMLAVTALSAVVVAAAAIAVGRRLAGENRLVHSAVAELGAGRVPEADGRRLTSEVTQVRAELRATAATLAATRERERSLETARRDLVSWVSHDLRTPLAGLRAMAEALEDGLVAEPELYYKQIAIAVDRLNNMVEDLFDLSRIQAGTPTKETDDIALGDLVSDCVAALEPLAAAQGVQLSGSVDDPAAVSGSGRDLNRALTNLVANAIRHTRAEGHVDVRVGIARDPLPHAELIVRDECGGIPVEHLDRVFDVGFRGEAARTPRIGEHAGAGLGLAITRGIVEAHDGTVDVENLPDGCRFRVRLPVSR